MQIRQYFGEVRIVAERKKGLDNPECRGDAVNEGFVAFPETAVAVAAEDLEHTEKDKDAKALAEVGFIHGTVSAKGVQIDLQQFFPKGFRIAGAGLPEEGGHIVINRTAAATLEVNEPGFSVHQHHIPRIEVPIEESVGRLGQEVRPEAVEIVLQAHFVEFQPAEFQKVVLEIVQVEIHHPCIEGRLRIAYREVQSAGAFNLDLRESGQGFAQQRHFIRAILTGGASGSQGIIQNN